MYLLVVGSFGRLLNYLWIPEQAFWLMLTIFVSVLALAAVLLSEQAQWRAKRFVALHVASTTVVSSGSPSPGASARCRRLI